MLAIARARAALCASIGHCWRAARTRPKRLSAFDAKPDPLLARPGEPASIVSVAGHATIAVTVPRPAVTLDGAMRRALHDAGIEVLRTAIDALEVHLQTLGDAVAGWAVAPLKARLAALLRPAGPQARSAAG